jgi:hypothetical protein
LTVYDGVLEDGTGSSVDDGFAGTITSVFQAPAVTLLAVFHAWCIVAFVEVLENGREHFRVLIRKVEPLVGRREELTSKEVGKEGAVRQDVLMRSEQSLLAADCDCDDGTNIDQQTIQLMIRQ